MLERLQITGIKLPRLYIARDKADINLAQESGLPYIVWRQDKDELVKIILRPILERMFPSILWDKVLGKKKNFNTEVVLVEGGEAEAKVDPTEYMFDDFGQEVADIAKEERSFSGGFKEGEEVYQKKLSLEEYVGDASSSVNVEVLQRLQLLPKFLGDIVDCIKVNLSNVRWKEGYNKKLGSAIGTFSGSKELPNLIILDVSGSIPRGISATMISLIDTLRNQVKADLIITSNHSKYYPYGEELPDPKDIRDMFGYGNEAKQFYMILDKYISGKEWGHVISFGDNDCPARFNDCGAEEPFLSGTKVHMVHHYHTGHWTFGINKTGYAKWCHEIAYLGGEEYDTDWCRIIRPY